MFTIQAGGLEVSCDPGIITKAAVCVNTPEVGQFMEHNQLHKHKRIFKKIVLSTQKSQNMKKNFMVRGGSKPLRGIFDIFQFMILPLNLFSFS